MAKSTKIMLVAVIAIVGIAIFSAQVYALAQFVQYATATPESVPMGASASATPYTTDYGCTTTGTITICTETQYNVEVPTSVAPTCDTCQVSVTEQRVLSQEEVEALHSK